MARKKKIEINWEEYVLDRFSAFFDKLDPQAVVLSLIFIYGLWKGYGATKLPTKADVLLGITLGLTVPDALKGGIVANAYATAALGAVGAGAFISDAKDPNEWLRFFSPAANAIPGDIIPPDFLKGLLG